MTTVTGDPATAAAPPSPPPPPPPPPRTDVVVSNWAGIHTARPASFYEPATLAEVRSVVVAASAARRTLRVVGAGHSPNDAALCPDAMLSLARLNRVLCIDAARGRVQVEAGITLVALTRALDAVGLALDSLGSISDQSVAGAVATGTHGSALGKPVMGGELLELQLVLADGSVATCSRQHNAGACVAGWV